MVKRLVVIGGTAAGLSAASKAKRTDPELEIIVFEKSGYVSYGACGLPYFVGDEIKEESELISLTPADLENKRGIKTFIHHQVTKIDRDTKTVTYINLNNSKTEALKYDKLVIATGASPIIPSISGVNHAKVHMLRNVEDGISLKTALASDIKAVSIIGGGLIGLEVAEQLLENNLEVSIFEAMSRLLPFLDEEYSEMVKNKLEQHGAKVYLNSTVSEIEANGKNLVCIKCNNGDILKTDLVLLSVGVYPNSGLAMDCGLQIGYKSGIVVDEYMQTSDDSIWACGDCVQMTNLITKTPTYIPMGTTANKQGKIAGGNIVGEMGAFQGVLGSQVTKIFDLYIAATGLTVEQAKAAGFDVATTKITKSDKASYYPGGKDNHICLIFDCEYGRLLGAQALGSESVAGRMNVFVTAITMEMTIPQINELDLVYSPSVAPVYDPILIAASQAIKKVRNLNLFGG